MHRDRHRKSAFSSFLLHPMSISGLVSSLALAATPALSQSQAPAAGQAFALMNTDMIMISLPLIIGAGALAFAGLVIVLLIKFRRMNMQTKKTGQNQIAAMRAKLDEYEAAFACLPEVSVLWTQSGEPQIFGKPASLGQPDMGLRQFLDFEKWLVPADAAKLNAGIRHLHANGQGFAASARTRSGKQLRAVGETNGGTAILHLRPASSLEPDADGRAGEGAASENGRAETQMETILPVLELLEEPAWIRNPDGKITFANAAYGRFCREAGLADAKTYGKEKESEGARKYPELFSPTDISMHHKALDEDERNARHSTINTPVILDVSIDEMDEKHELVLKRIGNSDLGLLRKKAGSERSEKETESGQPDHVGLILNAIDIPMVVFDRNGRLRQFNHAYRELFGLDEKWLSEGRNEREIIDLLRRQEQLPAEADYKKWRTRHLESYKLKKPRKETWHLPSGQTLEVIATPNPEAGGVIYVFEDISEQLKLQSSNNAMVVVQRETLNALSEGVAVFGTDGRLRLYNSRLSNIWKLPMNELNQNPHIDRIIKTCGQSIPEDGEEIWQRLKQNVVDFDPGRLDHSGRIKRKDGRLVDYAIVRLPDAQTLLTFVDVTKSANYETVLKERNEALETADRLKDAFIQNVSHELRVPLTSIIGFADLLASDSFGPLNEKQRTYTDYIRSSTAALGTLIDNILDLTNVDAGIARLDLEELDIEKLIEKAKTGFSATMAKAGNAGSLNLKVNMPNPAPRFVADGNRIVQILYNLLSNAVKFSDPGSEIELSVEENAGWIRFVIADQGISVPDELKKALKKPDNGRSLKELHRSSGIGLTVVKAFVELHGGNISMPEGVTDGNRVIVNLPADASALIGQRA